MSDTTSTTVSFKQFVRQDARTEHIARLRTAFAAGGSYTLGTILADLTGDAMLDTLLSLQVAELRDLLTPQAADKPARAKKESTDVKIANWSDAAVKADHAARVMAFLVEGQLGKGEEFARGFTPAELRTAIGGVEDQMRETLQGLEAAGKVAVTGDTKGKKYVVVALKAKAEAAFKAHQEAKAKAEAEKEARKASGEQPKGRKPKAAPAA